MSIQGVLECLLRIVDGSSDYFVSGSLSFLPLLGGYRQPQHDVDASIERTMFKARRSLVEREGQPRVLRFSEVAVADSSPASRVFAPRTDFIHLNTPEGLLDLTLYHVSRGFLALRLGAGLSLQLPQAVLTRVRQLTWQGIEYRAGPPEFAFLPKLVWYSHNRDMFTSPGEDARKHLADLHRLIPIIDWKFAQFLLAEGRIRWFGRDLPRSLDQRLNPFRAVKLEQLREELTMLAALHDRP
jgi:hypothetical protein